MGVYFKGYEVSPWDITKSYPIGSVVKYDGREYLAKKDVPVGINIGMSDYWDLGDDERLDNLEEAVEELDGAIQNLTLDDLGDVDLGTVSDGDILLYNSETEAFENVPSSSVGGSIDYSTTPIKVGKWIDGRDIYKVTIANIAINGEYTNITDALPSNADNVINVEGISISTNGTVAYPISKSNNYSVFVNSIEYTDGILSKITLYRSVSGNLITTLTLYYTIADSEESEE